MNTKKNNELLSHTKLQIDNVLQISGYQWFSRSGYFDLRTEMRFDQGFGKAQDREDDNTSEQTWLKMRYEVRRNQVYRDGRKKKNHRSEGNEIVQLSTCPVTTPTSLSAKQEPTSITCS